MLASVLRCCRCQVFRSHKLNSSRRPVPSYGCEKSGLVPRPSPRPGAGLQNRRPVFPRPLPDPVLHALQPLPDPPLHRGRPLPHFVQLLPDPPPPRSLSSPVDPRLDVGEVVRCQLVPPATSPRPAPRPPPPAPPSPIPRICDTEVESFEVGHISRRHAQVVCSCRPRDERVPQVEVPSSPTSVRSKTGGFSRPLSGPRAAVGLARHRIGATVRAVLF